MASYYNISADEMKQFLKADKGWETATQGNELVFNYSLIDHKNIQIKVYSGIRTNGQSRKCGADSIKVAAVDIVAHKGFIKSKRVHRVENWRDNLKSRIMQVIAQSKARLREAR